MFLVLNQFTVVQNRYKKRPDGILFVNGLPLVVIELKNAADENATIHTAFDQLQTYKETISTLFIYNAFFGCIRRFGGQGRHHLRWI
ncbi:type I restriction and modification enzyme subunit R-like protein [Hydrogenispora ethanolica]|uniref:type I site-specific deoxyribonuclease n=1 Tax=Hydrogenispora ethanolica TaxID=1082276 RepID=A0A4R1S7I5_HYDET|nr:type I restriction and modification enzyme subunit R-like protein [Hydrogenispora ethanolica]